MSNLSLFSSSDDVYDYFFSKKGLSMIMLLLSLDSEEFWEIFKFESSDALLPLGVKLICYSCISSLLDYIYSTWIILWGVE